MVYCVYGLFRPSLALELGIHELEKKSFTGEKPSVVVLEPTAPAEQKLLDSMYSSDRMSLVDGTALAASIGMLLGVIYGSLVYIGPIALGLIGLVSGGGAGYLLDKRIQKRRGRHVKPSYGEIMVAVRCRSEDEIEKIRDIMIQYQAVALGTVPCSVKGANSTSKLE